MNRSPKRQRRDAITVFVTEYSVVCVMHTVYEIVSLPFHAVVGKNTL